MLDGTCSGSRWRKSVTSYTPRAFKNRLVCIKDSAERGCGILGYFGYAAKKILMRVICEYEIEREFICLSHVERKEDNKITVSVDMRVDFLAK